MVVFVTGKSIGNQIVEVSITFALDLLDGKLTCWTRISRFRSASERVVLHCCFLLRFPNMDLKG